LPKVLGNFASSPEANRIISSPSSSSATPRLPTETLQAVRQLLTELKPGNSEWKRQAIEALLQLIDLADQSVMKAMHILLVASYPSKGYDKYSTPDKPSKSLKLRTTLVADMQPKLFVYTENRFRICSRIPKKHKDHVNV
jgi:hypothetical protein